MRKILVAVLILIFSVSLFGCAKEKKDQQATPQPNEAADKQTIYKNPQYGFTFTLTDTWQGYTIVSEKWEGLGIGSEEIVATGPEISIRHPQWTKDNPRQDIPIMIFTLAQWQDLQQEKFHIGAAPMGPSELGRNDKYVFALPARYNYAFPTGYEEVEDILSNHPLQASF
jgi:hypothetical protein